MLAQVRGRIDIAFAVEGPDTSTQEREDDGIADPKSPQFANETVMIVQQAGTSRIEALDSLRAICAICVVIFHLKTTGTLTNLPFFRHGWMLVDFFFVLSGFVITSAYAENLRNGFPMGRYVLLRLARVWPLHIVLLLSFLCLELSKLAMHGPISQTLFSPPRELGSLLLNLLLLQVYGIFDHLTWNVPSWSIAAEFWVYIIAALAFTYLLRSLLLVTVLTALCCLIIMALWGTPYLNLTYDGSVVRCLYGFCIGSCVFTMFAKRSPAILVSERRWRWTVIEAAFVCAAMIAIIFAQGPITLAVPPVFGLGVFIFAHQAGLVSAALNCRLPVWLGSISYSVYMTHAFIISRVFDATMVLDHLLPGYLGGHVVSDQAGGRMLMGSEAFLNLMLFMTICVIVAVSYLTYRWVEVPCNKWVRYRLGPWRQTATVDRPVAKGGAMPEARSV